MLFFLGEGSSRAAFLLYFWSIQHRHLYFFQEWDKLVHHTTHLKVKGVIRQLIALVYNASFVKVLFSLPYLKTKIIISLASRSLCKHTSIVIIHETKSDYWLEKSWVDTCYGWIQEDGKELYFFAKKLLGKNESECFKTLCKYCAVLYYLFFFAWYETK